MHINRAMFLRIPKVNACIPVFYWEPDYKDGFIRL